MNTKICLLTEKLSLISTYPKYRLGCIITDKRHNILSLGVNKPKSHPYQYKSQLKVGSPSRIYLHSEIDCIINLRRVNYSSNPYYAYVARTTSSGKLALAKPCLGCYYALEELGIRKIFYTDIDKWEELKV